MTDTRVDPVGERVRRPITVWVLTIWNGIYAGLVPAGLALLLLAGRAGAPADLPRLGMWLSVAVGLSVVAAAVGAWRGDRTSCIALLVLTTLHYGAVAFGSIRILAGGGFAPASLQPWGNTVRSLLTIAVNWYFLWVRARDFYT